ncbi:MAG: hypothetical protein CMP53_01170, partial [Flavobacteriales bacterium]|nr:hypothetical protein [Flavobacteriales bacterium]
AGLKILWTVMSVPVRPRPGAHEARLFKAGFFYCSFPVENNAVQYVFTNQVKSIFVTCSNTMI